MEPKDLSGALRTVLNILDCWDVRSHDRLSLLGCDQDAYDRWHRTGELGAVSQETILRLSYLLGIWKALTILFPDEAVAATWIHRPNAAPQFGGQTPLVVMTQGPIENLARVRHFLDGWCN